MRRRSRLLALAICVGLLALGAAVAQADWTTYHADSALSGVDQSSGTAVPFAHRMDGTEARRHGLGRAARLPGLVSTSPPRTTTSTPSTRPPARSVWHVNVGAPVPSAPELPCGDITPTVGITSTPVIDPSYRGSVRGGRPRRRGRRPAIRWWPTTRPPVPPVFSRSVEPPSNPLNQLQREGLALDGGRVLIGFGGNDGDCAQYKGFLVSAPANNSRRQRPLHGADQP